MDFILLGIGLYLVIGAVIGVNAALLMYKNDWKYYMLRELRKRSELKPVFENFTDEFVMQIVAVVTSLYYFIMWLPLLLMGKLSISVK